MGQRGESGQYVPRVSSVLKFDAWRGGVIVTG
jgi:hypothetical protein